MLMTRADDVLMASLIPGALLPAEIAVERLCGRGEFLSSAEAQEWQLIAC